ncbi:hypothetical protein SAMN05216337_1017116 [Bradyrhizobium brasilense]|uniref:Uncharacterized protein n=1 Tax=Bradyrhizobium brasilense TaxID=1419277 RepID=A0A1G6YVY1_9BRAD|nr:hypothetical protein [Bradyrhizobium brasilense]SDD94510.1 hypothetical protein SAMN05216337_1017116 [Bradyrhizobium brasilense]
MPALGNLDHERFCQALHKRVWNGEKQSTARAAAYRDTMYRGENPDSASIAHNARRLANRRPIVARLAELAEFSAKLAGVDSGWAMVKLKQLADAIEGFNLDDYLAPPDANGERYYDLSRVPREKLAMLTELGIEDEIETIGEVADKKGKMQPVQRRTRKIKLKGPSKVDMVGPIALMARIAGWEAPKKIAATTPEGKAITLADLIGASYAQQQRPQQQALPAPTGKAA